MDIQHKDIPDDGRHEAKGAGSATANSVLTAKGDGTTEFKKLTSANLAGTVGAGVLRVLANGSFTAEPRVSGYLTKTGASTLAVIGTATGITLAGGSFQVATTGQYLINVSTGIQVAGNNIVPPTFRNTTTGVEVFEGISAIVTLTAGVSYTFTQSVINFTVVQVV